MGLRVDLRQQAAITKAAERVVKDNWIDWSPLPTVAFNPQLVTPAGLFQPSRTWRLSVTATQPVFDGGQRKAVLRQRKAAVDQSLFVTTGLQVQARAEVRLAQESVRSLEASLATARTAVEQAGFTGAVFRRAIDHFGGAVVSGVHLVTWTLLLSSWPLKPAS